MAHGHGTCEIRFTSEGEKAKAFYELAHSKAQFTGIDKDTLVVGKKVCSLLESKNIKYQHVE